MAAPYELWESRKSLGVIRDLREENWYFSQFFTQGFRSTDEYIDFEKLPIKNRRLAPFAMPLARGGSIHSDEQRTSRFKPAYVKLEDSVDPLRPLTFAPGIDRSMIDPNKLSPMQRLELIKAAITADHVSAIQRRWEWLGARAIIDGTVTLTGKNYPTTVVNYQRASNHTITLGNGARFGDSGVSIIDFFQLVIDRMTSAEFGGMPTRATMGGAVWNVMRRDAGILAMMDTNIRGGNMTIERGLVSGGANGGKVYKVGEMQVGGASGARIELWVNNETYQDDSLAEVRYLGDKEIVFTSTPEVIQGYQCFGMIVDRKAEYQALPIFPANWLAGNNPQTEWIGHTSSPLMVPINPNATLKATVLA